MERKIKLAKLILEEIEGLKTSETISEQLAMAEQITKDSAELAKIELEEMSFK